jgi:hypothetical protein
MKQDISGTLLLGAWRKNVVEPYSTRQLTKSSDKLVALSAIAFEFSKKLSDQYLAGIWRADIERRGLLWHCRNGGNEVISGSPSWSWASVDGSILYLRMSKIDWAHCPEVIGVEYSTSPDNPFGRPHSASISLRAKVMDGIKLIQRFIPGNQDGFETTFKLQLPVGNELQLHIDTDLEPIKFVKEDGSVLISARRRRGEVRNTTAVSQQCFTYEGLYCLNVGSPVALVLGLTSLQSGTFERLGLCVLPRIDIEFWKRRDVTII